MYLNSRIGSTPFESYVSPLHRRCPGCISFQLGIFLSSLHLIHPGPSLHLRCTCGTSAPEVQRRCIAEQRCKDVQQIGSNTPRTFGSFASFTKWGMGLAQCPAVRRVSSIPFGFQMVGCIFDACTECHGAL